MKERNDGYIDLSFEEFSKLLTSGRLQYRGGTNVMAMLNGTKLIGLDIAYLLVDSKDDWATIDEVMKHGKTDVVKAETAERLVGWYNDELVPNFIEREGERYRRTDFARNAKYDIIPGSDICSSEHAEAVDLAAQNKLTWSMERNT